MGAGPCPAVKGLPNGYILAQMFYFVNEKSANWQIDKRANLQMGKWQIGERWQKAGEFDNG
jgi:hypothetical protein